MGADPLANWRVLPVVWAWRLRSEPERVRWVELGREGAGQGGGCAVGVA